VRVVVEREPETIVVAVEDDGPGVPEAHRSRIFEPFVRVDDQRAQTGTGLGLAIVKRLVEGHGETVTVVQSELGGLRVETRWAVASRGGSRRAEGGEQARDSNSENSFE
jgi:signal transduction histidine kinase